MSQAGHVAELESLRAQVADLTKELAEQDRSRRPRDAQLQQTLRELREESQRLRRQARHLLAAQALVHMGSWEWDLKTDTVTWSDEQYRLFGHEPGAIAVTSDTFLTALHPDDHDRVLARINEALVGPRLLDVECRIIRPNGEIRAIHTRAEVHRDETGRPLSLGGTALDITQRTEAETALRASEEFGRVVLNSLSIHIAVLDKDGTIVAVNDAWQRFAAANGAPDLPGIGVGVEYLDLCGRAMNDDEQARHILRGIDDVRAGRRSSFSSEYACHSSAEQRWLVLRATPLVGGTGGVVITRENISDRKQAEEALAHSARQLRTVLNTLPVGVCFTDATGKVLVSNPASHRIWSDAKQVGLKAEGELAAWWERADGRSTPHRWALSNVLTTGDASRNEWMDIECYDGSRKTISNSAVPVRDEQERIIGAIVVNEDITARVSAEDALRRTHAFLRSIVENIPYMIAVKDARDLRYIILNKDGEQLFGRPRHELIGKTAYDVLPEADADRVFAADTDALAQGGDVTLSEHVLMNQAGEPRQLLTKKIPIPGDDGTPAYLLTISEDITERKAAEQALRASEELFAKTFRVSPNPIGITEVESGRCIDINDACLELFGFRRDEVVGRTTLQLGLWPHPEEHLRFIQRLRQAGSIRNLVVNLRNKAGAIRQCLISAELIELRGKLCVVTVGQDITDQKRAEEELRRSHAFIRQVIDIDPNFIFAKDRDGRFTLVNQAVAEVYGTTVEALIGKTDADFNPNREEVEFFRRKDLEVMDSLQERFIPEERITDAGGAIRWLQTVKRPIVDEQGRATMVLGAATDITERKRMEEALRQRERDLRAALEERERISQDLHDGILQSLYAVGLGLESCKPLLAQRQYKEASATVEQAVSRLNQIMTEVRNFIAGLESEVLQGGDLETALRAVIANVTQLHPLRRYIHIQPEALPYISMECALQLFNILREALSNIVRHAQATRISVSLRRLKRTVRLRVEDDGVGFSLRTAAGTGYGLMNMAARAKKVGMGFELHSAVGKGTTIVLDLPREDLYAHREGQADSSFAR